MGRYSGTSRCDRYIHKIFTAYGFATMQAKHKQLAFMTEIQDKSIQIKGNPALVIWFQGLTKYLKPRKAKPKT
ncbi:hypothetical protein PS903_04962 [Pseudomonas fluorescens]|nr:hypothetical protein PS903_04962 [Pseudomonas fluorescens]